MTAFCIVCFANLDRQKVLEKNLRWRVFAGEEFFVQIIHGRFPKMSDDSYNNKFSTNIGLEMGNSQRSKADNQTKNEARHIKSNF